MVASVRIYFRILAAFPRIGGMNPLEKTLPFLVLVSSFVPGPARRDGPPDRGVAGIDIFRVKDVNQKIPG